MPFPTQFKRRRHPYGQCRRRTVFVLAALRTTEKGKTETKTVSYSIVSKRNTSCCHQTKNKGVFSEVKLLATWQRGMSIKVLKIGSIGALVHFPKNSESHGTKGAYQLR